MPVSASLVLVLGLQTQATIFTWELRIKQADKEIIHWAISPVQENLVVKVISTLLYLARFT